jgi:uncharacterized LabA/DUF88 family protein
MSAISVPSKTIALLIDGPNLHATANALGFDVDYKRLLGVFEKRAALAKAFFSLRSLKIRSAVPFAP